VLHYQIQEMELSMEESSRTRGHYEFHSIAKSGS